MCVKFRYFSSFVHFEGQNYKNMENKLGQRQSQTPFSSAFWVQKDQGSKKKFGAQKKISSKKIFGSKN